MNLLFWKAIFTLLRAVYPALWWYLICESIVTEDEVEVYLIELANELIGDTQQIAGVEVLKEAEV